MMEVAPPKRPSLYTRLHVATSQKTAISTHVETRTRNLTKQIFALMLEAVRTSETSVTFNANTRRYIPEDSKLQIFLRIFLTCNKYLHTVQDISVLEFS
jgi:hypothetical protein